MAVAAVAAAAFPATDRIGAAPETDHIGAAPAMDRIGAAAPQVALAVLRSEYEDQDQHHWQWCGEGDDEMTSEEEEAA